MKPDLSLAEIKTRHPFPWVDKTSHGIITIYDALGKEVGLLTLVRVDHGNSKQAQTRLTQTNRPRAVFLCSAFLAQPLRSGQFPSPLNLQ